MLTAVSLLEFLKNLSPEQLKMPVVFGCSSCNHDDVVIEEFAGTLSLSPSPEE